ATADGHVWFNYLLQNKWIEIDKGILGQNVGAVVGIQADPTDFRRLFAVTNGPGGQNVWYLPDIESPGGWRNISGDLPTDLGAFTIFADFQCAVPALYVGTSRGVYHSVDLGRHWEKFGGFLPNAEVRDLQYLPAQNILAAATFGRSAWEILTE